MSAVLESLWYGNVDPQETILADNRRYRQLLSNMGKCRDELDATLNEQQRAALAEYDNALNEMHSLAELEAFSYGVRFGIQLMIEAHGES